MTPESCDQCPLEPICIAHLNDSSCQTVWEKIQLKRKQLKDWLPFDYTNSNVDDRIFGHTNNIVIQEFDGRNVKWPGTHKNVYNWCILDSGHAIGWNESPSKGWSFIIKYLPIDLITKICAQKDNT